MLLPMVYSSGFGLVSFAGNMREEHVFFESFHFTRRWNLARQSSVPWKIPITQQCVLVPLAYLQNRARLDEIYHGVHCTYRSLDPILYYPVFCLASAQFVKTPFGLRLSSKLTPRRSERDSWPRSSPESRPRGDTLRFLSWTSH